MRRTCSLLIMTLSALLLLRGTKVYAEEALWTKAGLKPEVHLRFNLHSDPKNPSYSFRVFLRMKNVSGRPIKDWRIYENPLGLIACELIRTDVSAPQTIGEGYKMHPSILMAGSAPGGIVPIKGVVLAGAPFILPPGGAVVGSGGVCMVSPWEKERLETSGRASDVADAIQSDGGYVFRFVHYTSKKVIAEMHFTVDGLDVDEANVSVHAILYPTTPRSRKIKQGRFEMLGRVKQMDIVA